MAGWDGVWSWGCRVHNQQVSGSWGVVFRGGAGVLCLGLLVMAGQVERCGL